MTKKMNLRITAMITNGFSNKEIITSLKCKPQQVYNARYYKKKQDEEAAKVKRKYVRKQPTPTPVEPTPAMLAPTNPEEFAALTDARIIMRYEEQSIWQRIKRWLWSA